MAVQAWFQASPFILATGQEVLPMGGFTGQALQPTPARIHQLVSSGQLRFFQLVSGPLNGPEAYKITSWVRKTCQPIPVKDYSAVSAAPALPARTSRSPVALYEWGRGS